jgi:hypothetical protein
VSAEASAECCGVCRFYQRRDLDPAAADRARRAGFVVGEGHCRAHPQPLVKSEQDWCGEFRPQH